MSKTKKTAPPHLQLVPHTTRRHGSIHRPRTKAEWLLAEFAPDHPEFPLHPEVETAIPKELPGRVPTNQTELYADETAVLRAAKRSRPKGSKPSDVSVDE